MIVTPISVTNSGFSTYGDVAQPPDDGPTAAEDGFSYWSDVIDYRIDGATEIGYCTVYRREDGVVPWVERHVRTPELIVPINTPVVLPVAQGVDGEIKAFRIESGEAVVIGENVWHGACHPAEGEEATYFVIFRQGTPQEDVVTQELENVSLRSEV